jgi:hypothetical protein
MVNGRQVGRGWAPRPSPAAVEAQIAHAKRCLALLSDLRRQGLSVVEEFPNRWGEYCLAVKTRVHSPREDEAFISAAIGASGFKADGARESRINAKYSVLRLVADSGALSVIICHACGEVESWEGA